MEPTQGASADEARDAWLELEWLMSDEQVRSVSLGKHEGRIVARVHRPAGTVSAAGGSAGEALRAVVRDIERGERGG